MSDLIFGHKVFNIFTRGKESKSSDRLAFFKDHDKILLFNGYRNEIVLPNLTDHTKIL
jgi:hypothetical protein